MPAKSGRKEGRSCTLKIVHEGLSMKLRTHINLLVGGLSAAFLALVVMSELDSTRRAVREEISASNVVASQLLGNVVRTQVRADARELIPFLDALGRVRANEITLRAANSNELYRSPSSTYKAGREAPAWFTRLVLAERPSRAFLLPDGAELTITANPSRAILDGWDDIVRLLIIGVGTLGSLNVLLFWLVRRALSPLPIIAEGLTRFERGEHDYRLPPLQGAEARIIGDAFNDMARAVEHTVAVERQAQAAEARLEESRELSQLIEQRLDEERRMIARELHDEFAQSVTAIRSLAVAIAAQAPDAASPTATAAQVISSEAGKLYDAMHSLIPRLAPLTLDTLGLAETLEGFMNDWQQRHPSLELSLEQKLPSTLGPSVALTIYRIVQESLINALRHGQPSRVAVRIDCDEVRAAVEVVDDGVGLSADWTRPGRFGLRGLKDRVEKLHGSFHVRNRARGVEVRAEIPLQVAA